MNTDPPGIMLDEFVCEKCLPAMDKYIIHYGNTRLPALCSGKAPDEKLKVNKLGPHEHATEYRISSNRHHPRIEAAQSEALNEINAALE